MKHELLSLFFAAIVAMNMYATDVWDGSSDIFTHGAGTEQSPYLIENAEQLAFIAEMVNAGIYTYSGNYFKLTTDLDLNNIAWTPIGTETSQFGGNFDGGNHTISNLNITSATNAGLFGVVSGGVYKKLTIQGIIPASANATNAGGLIANASNVIVDSCTNFVNVISTSNAGGLIAYGQDVSMKNCVNKGNIVAGECAGGILGQCYNAAKKEYSNLQNYGSISGAMLLGGCIAALSNGAITNVYNSGSLTIAKNTVLKYNLISEGGTDFNGYTHRYFACEVNINIYVGGICGKASAVGSCGGKNTGDIFVQSFVSGAWEYNKIIVSPQRKRDHIDINVHNNGHIGGVFGYHEMCNISYFTNEGKITANFSFPAGSERLVSSDSYYYSSGRNQWTDFHFNNDFNSDNLYCRTANVSYITNVGGVSGNTKSSTIYSCSNIANITTTAQSGGVIGNSSSSSIGYSYNVGSDCYYGIGNNIETSNSYTVANNSTIGISSGTVTNSYYINGSGNGTQKTDAQMKSASMPILLNADSIVFIQDIKPNVNKGYPIFKNGMRYVTTNAPTDISYTNATLNGNYYNCVPDSMGFEYKESSEEAYLSNKIANTQGATYALQNLTQGTTYIARYWLAEGGITYYGDTIQFTTLACPTDPVRSDTVRLCQGESYEFAGKTLTQAGVYHDSLVATTGCDSVIELVLQVTDTYKYPRTETINRGESYDFYGQLLTEPGVYNEYIRTTNRCNWIELTLIVHEPDKTLTLNVNNPLWGSVIGAGTFEHGTFAEFSAIPAEGCYFVGWSDGDSNAERAILLTKDTTITANFAINQYTITTQATNGSVSGGGSYNYGTQVTLTATADEHYHFVHWNDGVTENPRIFVVTQDTTFTAEFDVDRTGTCGTDMALTWTYDPEEKVLTISGSGAFNDNMQCGVEARTELTKLVFEDGVTSVGTDAFKNCATLTELIIGKDVKKINDNAFYNCENLTYIYNYRPTPTNALSTAFDGVDKFECVLYVPQSALDLYKNASVWRDFYYIYAIAEEPTAVEHVQGDKVQCTKILHNGQIFIFRGNKIYTTDGRLVR